MKDFKKELAKPREVALYAALDSDFCYVSCVSYEVYDEHWNPLPDGQRRERPIKGYVRVSEPFAIQFKPIADDTVVANAVASLDEAEREAIRELNNKIAAIRGQKAQLLALVHQPAECDHEWEHVDYDPSVGMNGGKTCTKCGAWAEDDRGSDDDVI